MSKHNRERREFRQLKKAGAKLTNYQEIRLRKHARKKLVPSKRHNLRTIYDTVSTT